MKSLVLALSLLFLLGCSEDKTDVGGGTLRNEMDWDTDMGLWQAQMYLLLDGVSKSNTPEKLLIEREKTKLTVRDAVSLLECDFRKSEIFNGSKARCLTVLKGEVLEWTKEADSLQTKLYAIFNASRQLKFETNPVKEIDATLVFEDVYQSESVVCENRVHPGSDTEYQCTFKFLGIE